MHLNTITYDLALKFQKLLYRLFEILEEKQIIETFVFDFILLCDSYFFRSL